LTQEVKFEKPSLLDSASEPLLWIADATAWCVGAGGDWARRIAPVLAGVIDLDRP